jgi:hypothetical protein
MVSSLTAAGLLAGFVCLGLRAGSVPPRPSVGIFMDFDNPPTSLALDSMKREVESVMKSTGLALDWRSLGDNQGREAFSGLVVLRFRGKCQVEPWSAPDSPAGAALTLGTSQVSDGRVLPFSEVECEQVRKTVPFTDASACEQEKQCALGRAMGRVVAHELYHVLAQTTGHSVDGLAKATQSFRDLVSGTLRFQHRDAAAIRQGVSPGVALSLQ